jgi:hypothetical protein
MSRLTPSFMSLMHRRFPTVSALALAVGLTLAAGDAFAQAAASQPEPGPSVQAVDYAPIPAGSTFELQADDDLSQDTVDRVRSELANHGYASQDQAGLVMVIETDLIRGQKQDDPLGHIRADNDDAMVNARLFSTTQNSLLNPQQPIGSADRTYRINVSIYDRNTGLYVWRGSAMRSDPNLDIDQASNEMISALVGAVGKTVTPPPAQ